MSPVPPKELKSYYLSTQSNLNISATIHRHKQITNGSDLFDLHMLLYCSPFLGKKSRV